MNDFYKSWAKASVIRAAKTMAQTELALLLTKKNKRISTVLVAGLLSLLTSANGLPEVQLEKTLYDLDNVVEEGNL
jgi:hypothetical protein